MGVPREAQLTGQPSGAPTSPGRGPTFALRCVRSRRSLAFLEIFQRHNLHCLPDRGQPDGDRLLATLLYSTTSHSCQSFACWTVCILEELGATLSVCVPVRGYAVHLVGPKAPIHPGMIELSPSLCAVSPPSLGQEPHQLCPGLRIRARPRPALKGVASLTWRMVALLSS